MPAWLISIAYTKFYKLKLRECDMIPDHDCSVKHVFLVGDFNAHPGSCFAQFEVSK